MSPASAEQARSSNLRRVAILAVGDAAVFALFTIIGIINHSVGVTLYHFGRDFVPLSVAWFLVAVIVDTYGRGGPLRVAVNWLVGVTAGIIVRKWWVGSPNGVQFITFLTVALVTNGVFLLIWRFLAGRLLKAPSVAGRARESEAAQA
ncbi:MAG TPA: DUF3054 domain-containing protein [Actinomycetota bacterium]|nr:DUF3054 domain-containing protein [Actinomycetota bacterium]